MRNILLLILISFTFIGCGIKTDVFQTYEWDKDFQEYTTDGFALEKKMKFKISDKKISFSIEKDYDCEMKVLSKTDTTDTENDQHVFIYDCIMGGKAFRLVHYPDVPLVILYETLEDGIYQSFIVFGRDG